MEAEHAVIVARKGEQILVDRADFERLSKMKWRTVGKPREHTKYAVSGTGRSGQRMHRLILNAKKGELVDHINHNGLDNRRCNIRICTKRQNCQNRLKKQSATSKYKGVRYHNQTGHKKKWEARVRGKQSEYIGVFDTETEAALAYNEAAKRKFGEFACLNEIERATL